MCRGHRLIVPVLRHATGSAAMARELAQMDLDLKAISGPKAALITDGHFTLDHSEGHVYSHHDDPSIKITLFGREVRNIAAHYIIEHTGLNPTTPGRVTRTGTAEYAIPEIIQTIVHDIWLVPVQQMQLGLRPIRIFAVIREIISYCMSENHFIGFPGRIIRPDMVSTKEIGSKKRTDECALALDCRIRAVVKTDDIVERWAHKMGRRVQNDVRCH
eukprot:2541461-Pyramimonas_sp.AAC.1